ncbi:polynucleotide phosphorylase [Clostridium fungisolvens]|uniref:Uncharacterized protein n=1 Tax=Clostridium fungisolvens TaxID=1604897 RepID=A0A6V8SF36_9CLOT|nr:polynucleotide phosphorylase [Clostridium fungisolvens]GFP75411.1 hypothetical protein bsdtw1_01491 [Clostridium fungisolvens]
MEQQYLEKLKPMEYANMQGEQVSRLREVELKFNEEFGTDFYFMVMEKEEKFKS